jgi:hypothetical protein
VTHQPLDKRTSGHGYGLGVVAVAEVQETEDEVGVIEARIEHRGEQILARGEVEIVSYKVLEVGVESEVGDGTVVPVQHG